MKTFTLFVLTLVSSSAAIASSAHICDRNYRPLLPRKRTFS